MVKLQGFQQFLDLPIFTSNFYPEVDRIFIFNFTITTTIAGGLAALMCPPVKIILGDLVPHTLSRGR